MSTIKSYFWKQSQDYAQTRPHYPQELFEFIADQTKEKACALDVATGNGQAAISLTPYFSHVLATDVSAEQIACAETHPKITYAVKRAEETGLPSASVDLVTVATAIHWLDRQLFYKEVKRILKPGGVLAIFGYGRLSVNPVVDEVTDRLMYDILKDYWPPESSISLFGYHGIDFPFSEIPIPDFSCQAKWDFHQLVHFFDSYSATQIYKDRTGTNPVELIFDDLKNAWGNSFEDTKTILWKLSTNIGKMD